MIGATQSPPQASPLVTTDPCDTHAHPHAHINYNFFYNSFQINEVAKTTNKLPSLVPHGFNNPSTPEAEAGGFPVQG